MTNITLSIEDAVYKKMKRYSEIRWSDYVRKVITERIEELESIRKAKTSKRDSIFTMLASEDVLAKDWLNKADERWNNV